MAKIDAANTDIKNALVKLEKLTIEGGGWVHPDLHIIEEDGNLSMQFQGDIEEKEKLVNLTKDTLVPVNEMDIISSKGELTFTPKDPKKFSKIRHELAEVMFEIYNLTNKLQMTRQTNFFFQMQENQAVMESLTGARTIGPDYERMKQFFIKNDPKEMDDYVVKRFISTRVLGFGGKAGTKKAKIGSDASDSSENLVPKKALKKAHKSVKDNGAEDDPDSMPVLMPIIDYFNHNYWGARFLSPDNDSLEVLCRRPIKDSNECYGFYGVMDGLDTLLRYGFVDSHAAIVRSIPLQIDLPDLGRVVVQSTTPMKVNNLELSKKTQDLKEFMPVIHEKYDILTLSHLYLPVGHSPYMLRRILGGVIGKLAQGKGFSPEELKQLLKNAESFVKEQNLEFYSTLKKDLDKMKSNDDFKSSMAFENASMLANSQEEKLKQYKTLKEEEEG